MRLSGEGKGKAKGGGFWSRIFTSSRSSNLDPDQRAREDQAAAGYRDHVFPNQPFIPDWNPLGGRTDHPPSYGELYSDSGPSNAQPTTVDDMDDGVGLLAEVETVILIDDSPSMRAPGSIMRNGKLLSRWEECKECVIFVASVATMWDTNGIDIKFLNNTACDRSNITDASQVEEVFNSIALVPRGDNDTLPRLYGGTPTGRRLKEILGAYMRVYKMYRDTKPMNLITITDGKPDLQEAVRVAIRDTAGELDNLKAAQWQVGIQLFQVGDDHNAKDFLKAMDDQITNPGEKPVRDIVDTVKYDDVRLSSGQPTPQARVKIMVGALDKLVDAEPVVALRDQMKSRARARVADHKAQYMAVPHQTWV